MYPSSASVVLVLVALRKESVDRNIVTFNVIASRV